MEEACAVAFTRSVLVHCMLCVSGTRSCIRFNEYQTDEETEVGDAVTVRCCIVSGLQIWVFLKGFKGGQDVIIMFKEDMNTFRFMTPAGSTKFLQPNTITMVKVNLQPFGR